MGRYAFNEFDHLECPSLEMVKAVLARHGCHVGLVKQLPKNANDKKQACIHSAVTLLNTMFRLSFSERGRTPTQKKFLLHSSRDPGFNVNQSLVGGADFGST